MFQCACLEWIPNSFILLKVCLQFGASLQLSFLSLLSLCFMPTCLFQLAASKNFCGQKGHGVFLWVARWTLNVAAVPQYMLHLPHTKPLRASSGPACAGCSGCLVTMCCFSESWSLCALSHWWHTKWFFLQWEQIPDCVEHSTGTKYTIIKYSWMEGLNMLHP